MPIGESKPRKRKRGIQERSSTTGYVHFAYTAVSFPVFSIVTSLLNLPGVPQSRGPLVYTLQRINQFFDWVVEGHFPYWKGQGEDLGIHLLLKQISN